MAAFAEGLRDDAAVTAELNKMMSIGVGGVSGAGVGGPGITYVKTINYQAAENQSLDAEEALYAALGSPRVKD